MKLIGCLACLLAFTVKKTEAQVAEALSDWRTGQASFYGGELGMPSAPSFGTIIGSCGYGTIPQTTFPYWSVGALSTSNLFFEEGPVQGCGMCFQIQCINDGSAFQGKCNGDWATNSVTIMITDQCPECAPDQMDLQALTFGKLAPLVNGRILMQYRRVTCTPPDPITVRIDGNNGPGLWVRLWIERAAGTAGIQSVLIRGPGGSWQPMRNTFGAAWEINNAPNMPADLFVTSDDGQQVTLYGAVTLNSQGEVATSAQFSALPNPNAVLTTVASSVNPPVAAGSTSAAVSNAPVGSGTAQVSNISPPAAPVVISGTSPSSPAAPATPSAPSATQTAPATPLPPAATPNAPSSCTACQDANFYQSAYTCAQQAGWGQCSETWMTNPVWIGDAVRYPGIDPSFGYCAQTCGKCSC